MKKRVILCMAVLCVLLCVCSLKGYGLEQNMPVSGVAGEQVTWSIRGSELTLSGAGAMEDYPPEKVPWYAVRMEIRSVVIGSEITRIGENAFAGCRNLTNLTFQGAAPEIGENAFDKVISWGNYPNDAPGWTEAVFTGHGGIVVWKPYCVHSYTDVVTLATCTAGGYTTHVCGKCGESIVDTFTEIVPHQMTDWVDLRGYDQRVRSVSHRGSTLAPENTLIAYEQAKKQGFCYVETDVQFTKDGMAVLLHDSTIDRTSNGTGLLSDYTYEELMQFDFGSWKGTWYQGTKIPTFDEFLKLCRELELRPYVELKPGMTGQQAALLVELAESYGMLPRITWISFDGELLKTLAVSAEQSRVGLLTMKLDESAITKAAELKATAGEVFLDVYYPAVTSESIALAAQAGIPLEVWTVNDAEWIRSMDPYISGITSDGCLAGKILDGGSDEDENQRRSCLFCDYYEERTGAAGTEG